VSGTELNLVMPGVAILSVRGSGLILGIVLLVWGLVQTG
jgi:hypothetical protein